MGKKRLRSIADIRIGHWHGSATHGYNAGRLGSAGFGWPWPRWEEEEQGAETLKWGGKAQKGQQKVGEAIGRFTALWGLQLCRLNPP